MPNLGFGELLILAGLVALAVIVFAFNRSKQHRSREQSVSAPSRGHVRYYYHKNGRLVGPFDVQRLRDCLRRGSVDAETPITPDTGASSDAASRTWHPLRTVLPQLVSAPLSKDAVGQTASLRSVPNQRVTADVPAASKQVLVCAVGLLVAFFMPWVQLFGLSASGYNLGKLGSYGNYAWIVPILAGATIGISVTGANNRGIGAITGIVPLGAIAYCLVRVAGEGGAYAADGALNMAGSVLGIGAWLTIFLSIAIIWSAIAPASAIGEPGTARSEGLNTSAAATTVSRESGQSSQSSDGISAELARLAKLHSDGVLSPDEFKAEKAK